MGYSAMLVPNFKYIFMYRQWYQIKIHWNVKETFNFNLSFHGTTLIYFQILAKKGECSLIKFHKQIHTFKLVHLPSFSVC